MFRSLFALIVAVPVLADAQTPQDIARQLWPYGAPTSSNTAPRDGVGAVTGGGPADLARLSASGGTSPHSVMTPPAAPLETTGLVAADLARLRGNGTLPASAFMPSSPARVAAAR